MILFKPAYLFQFISISFKGPRTVNYEQTHMIMSIHLKKYITMCTCVIIVFYFFFFFQIFALSFVTFAATTVRRRCFAMVKVIFNATGFNSSIVQEILLKQLLLPFVCTPRTSEHHPLIYRWLYLTFCIYFFLCFASLRSVSNR